MAKVFFRGSKGIRGSKGNKEANFLNLKLSEFLNFLISEFLSWAFRLCRRAFRYIFFRSASKGCRSNP